MAGRDGLRIRQEPTRRWILLPLRSRMFQQPGDLAIAAERIDDRLSDRNELAPHSDQCRLAIGEPPPIRFAAEEFLGGDQRIDRRM